MTGPTDSPITQSEDTLAHAVQEWDAAVASDDAHALTTSARTIPWHVVRDCGPHLERTQREAIVAEGDVALAALAAAEDERDALPDSSTILDAVEAYVENVRRTCL